MQPNLLRNLCFLPTKNTKYRTFYRTHFLLISITCLSRYISLSFYRPALLLMLQYSRLPVSPKLQPMYYIVFSASLLETCLRVNWFLHLWTAFYFSYCCWPVWEWPVVALLRDKSRSLIGWKTETPVHQALWLVSVPNSFHGSWAFDNSMNEIWTGLLKNFLSKLMLLWLKFDKIVFLCCILNQFYLVCVK